MSKKGMKLLFGAKGDSHVAVQSGDLAIANGKTFTNVGNATFGSDGSSCLKAGYVRIGQNGRTFFGHSGNPPSLM